MDRFVIEGGRRLEGTVRVNGSKNASLPLMAAALLTDEPVTLRGVPDLADIGNMRACWASWASRSTGARRAESRPRRCA
jgi:UDP-N-acetylglucosamine enolpyruvyl transferase